jgi:hypothetical protein
MGGLSKPLRGVCTLCVTVLFAACSILDLPATPTTADPTQVAARDVERALPVAGMARVNPEIPSWVLNPEDFPPGLRGKNNCTFAFGQNIPQWDFHPDAGCWERPGPDGWTRQQQYKLHVAEFASCGGGPADVSPIRVCLTPGLANPCPINPTTGPNGCALCVRSVTCH